MIKLIDQVKKASTKQDYSPKRKIKDVLVVELKRFTGGDGSFNELVRIKGGKLVTPKELAGFEVRQINHSKVVSGSIKAWHYHLKQDEIWFIHPEAKLIVGLLDLRFSSSTKKLSMKLSLGDGRAHLVYIPRGVAHGVSNPYPQPATMSYLVNNWFDGGDEWRLPFDFLVEEDFWKIEKG